MFWDNIEVVICHLFFFCSFGLLMCFYYIHITILRTLNKNTNLPAICGENYWCTFPYKEILVVIAVLQPLTGKWRKKQQLQGVHADNINNHWDGIQATWCQHRLYQKLNSETYGLQMFCRARLISPNASKVHKSKWHNPSYTTMRRTKYSNTFFIYYTSAYEQKCMYL